MESSRMETSPHCIVKIGYVKKNGQLCLGGGGGKHPFDIHAILRHYVSLLRHEPFTISYSLKTWAWGLQSLCNQVLPSTEPCLCPQRCSSGHAPLLGHPLAPQALTTRSWPQSYYSHHLTGLKDTGAGGKGKRAACFSWDAEVENDRDQALSILHKSCAIMQITPIFTCEIPELLREACTNRLSPALNTIYTFSLCQICQKRRSRSKDTEVRWDDSTSWELGFRALQSCR